MIKQGDVLNGTYLIKGVLGSGGGGIIYRAYHLRLKTDVVVKQIREEVKGHIEGRAEADVLKKLRHSHLPRVYDFLEINGEIYTVMDFIPGENLSQAMQRNGGPFSQKQVVTWAGELAEALEYLHGMHPPIIHSDIKPSNIMLQPDGHLCLIDFNISLAFDSSGRTSTGISDGFSPPEQYHSREMYQSMSDDVQVEPIGGFIGEETAEAKRDELDKTHTARARCFEDERSMETVTSAKKVGMIPRQDGAYGINSRSTYDTGWGREPDTVTAGILNRTFGRGVDERSDIYSLGATLYLLVTGIKPSSRYWEIIPIDRLDQSGRSRVKISQGLSTIIKKAMELDPQQRYQNGAALKHAIDHIKDLDDTYRRYKAGQRAGTMITLALLAASVGLMVSGYFVMQQERGNEYNRRILAASDQIQTGAYDEAEDTIASAQTLITERIDAYEAETRRLYEMGDYEACIRYGMETINSPLYAIETEADVRTLANLYYLLGNAYFETGDYSNAVSFFQSAIEQWEDNGAYYRDLAICLARAGNVRGAEEALVQAQKRGLAEDSIYMVQGEIAYGKQEYEDAVALFRKVLSITDSDEITRRSIFLCADAYRQLDTDFYQEEIAFLESYEYTFGGQNAQLTEILAEAYAKGGEIEKSIAKFEELIERGYANFRTYENLAILQHENSDLNGAKETLNTMQDLYPNRYETYKRLAFLEADIQNQKPNEQRDYHQMKEYYDQAVSMCDTEDPEMQRLDIMMRDLVDGGWF